MSSAALVQIRNVHKHFSRGSERIEVLKGVSLEIPKGDYLAVLEIAPAAKLTNWRDLFVWEKSREGPRYDIYATVFSTSGLAACTREVTAGVPSPIVNVVWGS